MNSSKFWIGAVAAIAGIAFLVGRGSTDDGVRFTPAPPILEKVQALGELHTARYTYQNVFEHATARRPAEWASYVPGAASLVRATTQNRALVEVKAEVEAGVDLGKAEMEKRPGQPDRLLLPHARVYRPQVDATVHDVRRGLLWRDDNIALDAERDAAARLREAAIRQGILRTAEANVAEQVARILPAQVEIAFR
jgi:hypothetical protein